MKKKDEYSGSWLDYISELESLIPQNTIDINFSFFKESFEYGIRPKRAVKMLVR
jgi:hypothetical protein